ncbi:MAG: hypothetical protein R6W84_06900 [Promethearchaeia archaeon]
MSMCSPTLNPWFRFSVNLSMISTSPSFRAVFRRAAISPNSIVSVVTSGIVIIWDCSLNRCSGPK